MKIKDFKLLKRDGGSPLTWFFEAEVTIETGFWLLKKVEKRVVCKSFADYWRYKDTGKYTEKLLVENAEKVYEFNNGKITEVEL